MLGDILFNTQTHIALENHITMTT